MNAMNLLGGFVLGSGITVWTAYEQTKESAGWLGFGIALLVVVLIAINIIDYSDTKEKNHKK